MTLFSNRHIGPNQDQIDDMLQALGLSSLQELIDLTIPQGIRSSDEMDLP